MKIQQSTVGYDHIFLHFYEVIAENHRKKIENQSKLKKILNDVESQRSCNQQQSNFAKKISLATECSLTEQQQNQVSNNKILNSENWVFLTFFPNNNQNEQQISKKTINLRYRAPSIYKVMLYALTFNHLHLKTIIDKHPLKMAHVFNHGKNIIEALLITMQEIQKAKRRNGQSKDGESLQPLINYLRNFPFCHYEKIHYDLKHLIENLNDDAACQIFWQLAYNKYNSKNNLESTTKINKQASSSQNNQFNLQDQPLYSSILALLALVFNIRIKVQNQKEKLSWGDRGCIMCYIIKQQPCKQQFFLKEVIYYRQQRKDNNWKGEGLKKTCLSSQLIRI